MEVHSVEVRNMEHDWSMWLYDDPPAAYVTPYAVRFCYRCGVEWRTYRNRWGYGEIPASRCEL